MVELLLDSGAGVNVNLRDSTGDTSIMYAAYGTGEGNIDFGTFFKIRTATFSNMKVRSSRANRNSHESE